MKNERVDYVFCCTYTPPCTYRRGLASMLEWTSGWSNNRLTKEVIVITSTSLVLHKSKTSEEVLSVRGLGPGLVEQVLSR